MSWTRTDTKMSLCGKVLLWFFKPQEHSKIWNLNKILQLCAMPIERYQGYVAHISTELLFAVWMRITMSKVYLNDTEQEKWSKRKVELIAIRALFIFLKLPAKLCVAWETE